MTLGLQTDVYTWVAAFCLTGVWLFSVPLCPGWREYGWRSVLLSIFGCAWAGFGLNIIIRFFMLCYDCVTLGNMSLRLAILSPATNTRALLYLAAYWLLFCGAYLISKRTKSTGLFVNVGLIAPDRLHRLAVPVTVFACVAYFVVTRPSCPRFLITPIAVLANTWVLVAAFAWYLHFQRHARQRFSLVLFLVLVPGVFLAILSPYREHLVAPVLIPVLTALATGRKIRLRTLAVIGVVFLLLATVATRIQRAVRWGGENLDDTLYGMQANVQQDPYFSVVAEPLRRFHSIDSLLVTMSVVPRAVPYSGRNVFVSALIGGIVPRAIYANKAEANQGIEFGASIWSYEDASARLHASGSIAPSLVGDLYGAGGFLYVVLGAICIGALFGRYDGWRQNLPVYAQVGMTILLLTHAAAAIERDFSLVVGNFIQTTLMIVVVSAVAAGKWRLGFGWVARPARNSFRRLGWPSKRIEV